MSWREDLRRVKHPDGRVLIGASFRGVAFFVDEAERSGGRRTVKHEFPFADDPFYEDLGRKARDFHITGYVLGDDYLTQRDTLMAALEDEEGSGELVHPYDGVRNAICDSVSVHTSKADGGIATFTIAFCETPTQAPQPTVVVDGAGQVSTSADAADAATDAEFLEQYDSTGLPAHALASAEAAIAKASAALKDKLASVISATQEAAQLTGQLALITAEASSLVRAPASILSSFRDAITALSSTILNAPVAVYEAMVDTYSVDLGDGVFPTTATRVRELANQTALTSALRRVFAVYAARLAPVVPYVTVEDAIAARDQVTVMLDEQAALASNTAYPAIVDLRSQVLSAVPGGATFASIVTVTRNVPIPSLLLTYQIYGSVDLELDVVARNDIAHPGFIAGDLKVLSNDA